MIERGRRGTQEAARDREMLCWVGRLRVVSSEELSLRFGVSEQRINARVRRLLEAGLLGQLETWRSERRLVYLSRRGAGRVGMPLRRPPQPDLDIEPELMLGRVVALLETREAARVLTQREARQAERATGRPHSIQSGMGRRWPDLIIEADEFRRAVVVESAPVPGKKLAKRILDYVLEAVSKPVA